MYNFEDIRKFFAGDVEIAGEESIVSIDNARTLAEANEHSLIWIKGYGPEVIHELVSCPAPVIVCDKRFSIPPDMLSNRCFIKSDNPKLLFSRLVNGLFVTHKSRGIHPTAIISKEAVIGDGTEIGAYTVIEKCIIGKNCNIGNSCHLEDNTQLGDNVTVGSCSVIGSCGYGYSRDENGELVLFPHIGGVIIEDDVEIGTNTSIDRGALGNTIIRKGSKIDNLVIIAHNVIVGEHTLVIGGAILCGSSQVGKNCWIAPGACVRNGKKVGDNCTVGLGAIVTKDIPDGDTWIGNPAVPIKAFQESRNKGDKQ